MGNVFFLFREMCERGDGRREMRIILPNGADSERIHVSNDHKTFRTFKVGSWKRLRFTETIRNELTKILKRLDK